MTPDFLNEALRMPQCSFASDRSISIHRRLPSRSRKGPMPALPVLAVLSLLTVAQASPNCCSLAETELIALKGTNANCPSSSYSLIVKKCDVCPKGTCRVDFTCLCPDYFLTSSTPKFRCEDSFGSKWPASIGQEDIDWRSCTSNPAKQPPASTISCCSLSEQNLTALRGTNENCPSNSYRVQLADKCQVCPRGTCRLDFNCRCPGSFLSSSFSHTQCTDSFTASWPASVGKEDIDWRSCSADHKPLPRSINSCCALTKDKLTELRGTSDDCPDSSYNFKLAKKCQSCPPGTCRLDEKCRCPGSFLSSSLLPLDCASSFTSSWPASVGNEDIDWRSCMSNNTLPPASDVSCCALSEKKLTELRGRIESCPSNSFSFPLSEKCEVCPPGTCRIDLTCRCPDFFLTSLSRQVLCQDSFGSSWPASVGMEDSDWSTCSGNPVTTGPAPTTTATSPTNATTEASRPKPTPAKTKAPTVGDSNASGGLQNETAGSLGGGEKSSLTTLEVVGIVAGVVSTVIAAIGAVFGILRWHRKR